MRSFRSSSVLTWSIRLPLSPPALGGFSVLSFYGFCVFSRLGLPAARVAVGLRSQSPAGAHRLSVSSHLLTLCLLLYGLICHFLPHVTLVCCTAVSVFFLSGRSVRRLGHALRFSPGFLSFPLLQPSLRFLRRSSLSCGLSLSSDLCLILLFVRTYLCARVRFRFFRGFRGFYGFCPD